MLKKNINLLIIIVIIFFLSITLIITTLSYLSKNSKTSFFYFTELLIKTKKNRSLGPEFNLIILGLDPRDDKLEKTSTTDTIIFAGIKPDMQINLISLPRDLWDYQLSVKINQIYPLSLNQIDKFNFIQNNFSSLINQRIDRTLILTTKNLIDIVNIIGGVDVYLDKGFRDELYPNPEFINNPISEIPKYRIVEFNQGLVHLDASNVTEFVRSRKSSDNAVDGGTDIGRIQRQQLLVDSLINKLKTIEFYKQPKLIFSLYSYWHEQISTNITDQDLVSFFLNSYHKLAELKLNKIEIPTGENPQTDIIYHPKSFINSQWVFIPQDKSYRSLQKFINDSLSGK